MKAEIYNWDRIIGSKVYADIKAMWVEKLADVKLKEQDYHSLLQKHPALFLASHNSYLVVSKLKLGSDYETDFVIVKEGYSDGTIYELVELETPHTKLFDQSGKPTAKLNSALQQIRDWKRCLKEDKGLFKKIFPTANTRVVSNSRLRFKIIIGRRTDNAEEIEKRKQIADEQNVEIVSYDRLTDKLNRSYFLETAQIYSSQMDGKPYELRNALANPFYTCISDSDWRQICRRGDSHIYHVLLDEILNIREYNDCFEKFKIETAV